MKRFLFIWSTLLGSVLAFLCVIEGLVALVDFTRERFGLGAAGALVAALLTAYLAFMVFVITAPAPGKRP